MQNQKSIRSFFQKVPQATKSCEIFLKNKEADVSLHPPPSNNPQQQPAFFVDDSFTDIFDEIREIDTPPEKAPRPAFTRNFSDSKVSPFSSIMHKLVKEDRIETSHPRDQVFRDKHSGGDGFQSHKSVPKLPIKVEDSRRLDKSLLDSLHVNTKNDNVIGPATPGTKLLVPGLKRVKEESRDYGMENNFPMQNFCKKLKFFKDTTVADKEKLEVSDSSCKFEWLIHRKDANGRTAGDLLYDSRTLHIPSEALGRMSASQRQYWDVKCKYMDIVLFFKVGKFYELYELDAEIGHKELDWKITLSGVGKCRQVGISESGIDDSVQKLVSRGYKVGRIEQLESSDEAKSRGPNSVVRRKLVSVITPATVVDGNIGPNAIYLLSIKEVDLMTEKGSTIFGFALVECASSKFWVGSACDDTACASALGSLLMQVSPREVIYEFGGLSKSSRKALEKYPISGCSLKLTPTQSDPDFVDASDVIGFIEKKGYFKRSSTTLDFALHGVEHCEFALMALGSLIRHLSRLMMDDTLYNGDILTYQPQLGCLRMDGQTLVNLEVFGNNDDGGLSGTLYKYLDSCMTSSGKRLLRNWICYPLRDVEKINSRLDIVEILKTREELTSIISLHLRKLPDLERLLGRAKTSCQSSSLLLVPHIGPKILKQRVKVFGILVEGLRNGMDLLKVLENDTHISPPLFSNLLKPPLLPFHALLDELDHFLSQFEAAIISDFPNYKDYRGDRETDGETLSILTELLVEKFDLWSILLHALGCIDVLRSFAVTASTPRGPTCRPTILPSDLGSGPTLLMRGLWHPFALDDCHMYVPNDVLLGGDESGNSRSSLLLTGPNMGGKSTLMRATCLAVIMAQMGCYVPCESCILSPADAVFTRLGASDRIMAGESTFFVECSETASVLRGATGHSLVLLDELGRGTSTFDGYAIAYAVLRHLVEKVRCRLLFATHYHPLTKEFARHPQVSLQHMSFSLLPKPPEECWGGSGDGEVVFLYRLEPGACPESYGLQAAAAAGIPKPVLEAASVAGRAMKAVVGGSFGPSEQRSEFSTLHEGWLKSLVQLSRHQGLDDDTVDSLFCLWHEIRSFV